MCIKQLKIHNNCPGELDEVVAQLEEATGSVVVGRIGRTVIIYRPSLTKLISEEKKKQALKVFLKRRAAFKSSYQVLFIVKLKKKKKTITCANVFLYFANSFFDANVTLTTL